MLALSCVTLLFESPLLAISNIKRLLSLTEPGAEDKGNDGSTG
ncbi:hypothetical protein O23A_p3319 [Aeromonas salmonicida]|nr:hypothetical protein O23A_p3319 [Aeromonas salmonicida]